MKSNNIWQAVLGEIELSISHGNFITWFKNTQLISDFDGEIIIGVNNIFVKQQLEKKFIDNIKDILEKNGVQVKTVSFKIQNIAREDTDTIPDNIIEESVENNQIDKINKTYQPLTNSLSHTYRQGLNEKYTFDNFIVGDGNELAFAACQAIVSQPGTRYNPLFIYGGVGIGKTHLIQAVGNYLVKNNNFSKVLYISTEQFVQEFVDALRFRKTADFVSHYRTADVLIVDDVQFIAGKEKIQEEFFHTFNALHQANKQIIISSDKPPKDIPTLEDRLKSRFAWGMSIDMQNPDFETRCAIIKIKTSEQGIDLTNDVIEFLANNIQTNIRELEGALNQLLAFCEMRQLEPNLAITSSLFSSIKTRPKHLSSRQIVEKTARYFQIQLDDILGAKRDKDIVVPRQVAMYILRSELHLSFPKIARELGRKDHTTAIHSVDKIEKESKINMEIKKAITEITEKLYV
jgi:chromosomal replication initiator protein